MDMQFSCQIPGPGRDNLGRCHLYLSSESPFPFGGGTSNSQTNITTNLPSSGNILHCHCPHALEHYDHTLFYEIPPPPHSLIQGHFSPIYNPYLTPALSSGCDQITSSSSHRLDRGRDLSKQKNYEGVLTNHQYFYPSACFNQLVSPVNSRQFDEALVVGTTSSPWSQNGRITPHISNLESQRSVSSIFSSTGLDYVCFCHGQMIHGIYSGRPFHPIHAPWFEHHCQRPIGEWGASFWNGSMLPHFNGSSGLHGILQRNSNNRGSRNISHNSCPIIQAVPHHNVIFGPIPFHDHSSNDASTTDAVVIPNTSSRFGSYGSVDIGNPHPLRGRNGLEPTSIILDSPNLRHLPLDEVAILDIHGSDNFIDYHRGMRLDIDEMSYEELLALGERIGNVKSGLSEEALLHKLNTRTFISSPTPYEKTTLHLDQGYLCVICQSDFMEGEMLGILGCGHEYHADCLKKWLLIKNICPICKSPAFLY